MAVLWVIAARAEITLDRCLELAHDNYPLIKKYELLEATEAVDLSDINRGWLPRLSLYAQGTVQNVVPSYPETLSKMMTQMGAEVKGLGKVQYKVGLDLNQTIWDGGASKAQREIVRRRAEVNTAALEVDIYGIRQRVESYYFAILLIDAQIEQTRSAIGVYEANLEHMKSLVASGVAMQADADMIEAQLLGMRQRLAQAQAAVKGYRAALSVFTGTDLAAETLALPAATLPSDMSNARPELALMDSRQQLTEAQRSQITTSIMPKIGLFAQSYYGYPGMDYFKAMMNRDLTFNVIAGVKVQWNIDAFYTKKNSNNRLALTAQEISADRETFEFNTRLQTASQLDDIRGIETVMADDSRIVELRRNVRIAAESRLRNGVIDATALTTKINDETQAAIEAAYHKIQYIQAIYNLKNTLNR